MAMSDILYAAGWWLVLLLLGAAATPLTLTLFKRLPDRGYAFVKLVGLLLVSYLLWIMSSLGWLGNDAGGITFALLGLLLLSIWAAGRRRGTVGPWLREHRSQVLITELIFALVFGLWVWVRAQNPAIVATEKPMEFAFLNAIGRSPAFPPNDPWLSGFAISYYYFGYVMTSVLARLALVPEPVAFNLAIAWLVAGTAVASFGLVYNLIALNGSRRAALILGIAAAAALPIAGNMEIGLELLHQNGAGSSAFWEWLDMRDLSAPARIEGEPRYDGSSWWWWRSSRVIHEYHLSGRPEEGLEPIAEFPSFSFVLGDMHPHVLALPFALLSLAVALAWWLGRRAGSGLTAASWDGSGWPRRLGLLLGDTTLPLWFFTALLLGGLSFLNTWDVLIHLFVVLGAFLLRRWQRDGWHARLLPQLGLTALMLVLPAVIFYFPFYVGFRSQAGAPFILPMLMRPTRLAHFLTIFGMPLWAITLLLLGLGWRQRFRHWRTGLKLSAALVGILLLLTGLLGWLVASSIDGSYQVVSLANEMAIPLDPRPETPLAFGWGLRAVMAIAPAFFSARLALPGVTLLLAGMLALIVMVWVEHFQPAAAIAEAAPEAERPLPVLPFVLLLAATGALLTLGPEFVYLKDNFGVRLNTVFKFYYQAWVLFGTAALFAVHYLWQGWNKGGGRLLSLASALGYALALLVALQFPLHAVSSRALEHRGPLDAETRQPPLLDGLTRMKLFNPDEYEAVMWLRQNVEGAPFILEAVGGQYSEFGRISASTGLPTVLGWAGHEFQWRGSANPEPGQRDPAVRQIYMPGDWGTTVVLLDKYRVEYIYVGNLERSTYGPQVDQKFDAQLPAVFRNDSVTIYRWQPQF